MEFLRMKNICKSFGSAVANNNAELMVNRGEIHALLGENGAGKSTLMNILSGFYRADTGEIWLDGEKVSFLSPQEAIHKGIGMVHQHFMLIPEQSVIENVILGKSENPFVLDIKEQAEKFRHLSQQYNMEIDPWTIVGKLSVGEQQRVEILKALYRNSKLLILDEPTAVLTPQESRNLFKMIRKLSSEGCTVIFITHKLMDITEVCTNCTVLRKGATVYSIPITPSTDKNQLAYQMVGRAVEQEHKKIPENTGEEILRVSDLNYTRPDGASVVKKVNLQVHEGEIVGICGVDGNGQSELIKCITGILKPTGGKVEICNKDCSKLSVKSILRLGVAHIPEDRLKMGMVKSLNLSDNLILMHYDQPPISRHGLIDWHYVQSWGMNICKKNDVRMQSIDQAAGDLSGGNQQKLVVGRELEWNPKLLIAVHPNRGLDISAAGFITNCLIDARNRRTGILLVSTDLDELIEVSDRILVIYNGQISASLTQSEFDKEQLGKLMMGIQTAENKGAV